MWVLIMSDVASLSIQEQQFFESVQQAIDNQSLDRLILSQYKGELIDLEIWITFFFNSRAYLYNLSISRHSLKILL